MSTEVVLVTSRIPRALAINWAKVIWQKDANPSKEGYGLQGYALARRHKLKVVGSNPVAGKELFSYKISDKVYLYICLMSKCDRFFQIQIKMKKKN